MLSNKLNLCLNTRLEASVTNGEQIFNKYSFVVKLHKHPTSFESMTLPSIYYYALREEEVPWCGHKINASNYIDAKKSWSNQ